MFEKKTFSFDDGFLGMKELKNEPMALHTRSEPSHQCVLQRNWIEETTFWHGIYLSIFKKSEKKNSDIYQTQTMEFHTCFSVREFASVW